MKTLEIEDDFYEAFARTARMNDTAPEDFLRQLISLIAMPEGNQGIIMFRQIVKQTPIFMNNISKNLRVILNGKSVNLIKHGETKLQASRAAVVVANGPSLTDEQLELLKTSKFRSRGGMIIVCDSALKRVLRAGIYPDIVTLVDSAIYAREFFDDPVVERFKHRLHYAVPVDMHPDVVSFLRGEIYWYQPFHPRYPCINLTEYMDMLFPEYPALDSGGNVGCFTMCFADWLEKEHIALLGFDHSWPGTTKPEDTENYFLEVLDCGGNAIYDEDGKVTEITWPCTTLMCPDDDVFEGKCKKRQKEDPSVRMCQEELDTQFVYVDDKFGNKRLVETIYDIYLENLEIRVHDIMERTPDKRIINCSKAGLAYPEGMLDMSLKEYFEDIGVL
jgi:hypothetical protein